MPIIINGGSRRAGTWWAKHLTNAEKNERVEIAEICGLVAETVADAFTEMKALAAGTKCENYFYQANINPHADEHLTPEQWTEAVDTLERNLGLTGQPRFVVEHEKEGRTHRHIVWSRIDIEQQKAIPDSLTAKIHEQTSRELEVTFDLEPGKSVLVRDRKFERPERGPEKWAMFRGERHGLDPRAITAELTELWNGADTGHEFKAAIEERGYILARGDRRDFVVVDQGGDVHSLARRIQGAKAQDIRDGLADLDRDALPDVREAKAQIELREQVEPSLDALPCELPDRSTADREEPSAEAGAEAFGSPREDPGGNPLRGIARILDGVANIAENALGLLDGLTGGGPLPQPQPKSSLSEPQSVPVGEYPAPSAPLDPDTRREAVLRAIAEMQKALRQDEDRRDREAGRTIDLERDRAR
ncbi:MAG TPA: relaxase/mobilization nuclease domain-containing protein [Rhizomicrobium sp.]|nr:relaxase/mobilization nuclease domain-containing protein [Rhizomicrobium sp.]